MNKEDTAGLVTAKLALPVGTIVANTAGWTVNDLILYGTAFYTLLLIIHKLWSMYKDFRGNK